jgi:hypothetical protein
VRLVIEGTIIVIVPLITSFLLNALMLLAPVVNLIACISVVDDCHTPFRERGNEASIRVPRMFKSHA